MTARIVRAALLASSFVAVSDAHGFITTPTSRNTLVCDSHWPDYLKHYNSENFVCKTDRESHCPPMPGKMKDCQGSSTGQFPGRGVPLAPFGCWQGIMCELLRQQGSPGGPGGCL